MRVCKGACDDADYINEGEGALQNATGKKKQRGGQDKAYKPTYIYEKSYGTPIMVYNGRGEIGIVPWMQSNLKAERMLTQSLLQ